MNGDLREKEKGGQKNLRKLKFVSSNIRDRGNSEFRAIESYQLSGDKSDVHCYIFVRRKTNVLQIQ